MQMIQMILFEMLIIYDYSCASETTTQIYPTVPPTSLNVTAPVLAVENSTNEPCGKNLQWRIYMQKFPARALPPPPTGPNSFIFTYVFTEKCLCQRFAPLQQGLAPPQREILDPPLIYTMNFYGLTFIFSPLHYLIFNFVFVSCKGFHGVSWLVVRSSIWLLVSEELLLSLNIVLGKVCLSGYQNLS